MFNTFQRYYHCRSSLRGNVYACLCLCLSGFDQNYYNTRLNLEPFSTIQFRPNSYLERFMYTIKGQPYQAKDYP